MNSVNAIKRSRAEAILDAREKQQHGSGDVKKARVRARAKGSAGSGCRSTSAQTPVNQLQPAVRTATKVTARIDVGFGNSLFIRGEGNGLSWEQGQRLTCVDGAAWVWSGPSAGEESVFKLLLNDQVWCQGENLRVDAGSHVEMAPVF